VLGLMKPAGVPCLENAYVCAEVRIPLRPIIEASQFEARGALEPTIEALRFYCERKVKGHGFVRLSPDHLVISLLSEPGHPAPSESLREEWLEALNAFSKLFGLTYSTWKLPVYVRLPGQDLSQDQDAGTNSAEAA
jgi:hypothetical protein